MLEFIRGYIEKITPTYAILENNGIGYFIKISLHTFEKLKGQKKAQLLIHEILREDTHDFFGFFDEEERTMFRLLISVSGVGANTACVILSKLQTQELAHAIVNGDVALIQSVKGIGAKSAQRVILDLKDKVVADGYNTELFVSKDNTLISEALSALVMLGYAKGTVEKTLRKIMHEEPITAVEDLVKMALKRM